MSISSISGASSLLLNATHLDKQMSLDDRLTQAAGEIGVNLNRKKSESALINSGITVDDGHGMSLASKVAQSCGEMSVNLNRKKRDIETIVASGTSDPGELIKMQAKMGEYSTSVGLMSALTHKCVDAASTLLKS